LTKRPADCSRGRASFHEHLPGGLPGVLAGGRLSVLVIVAAGVARGPPQRGSSRCRRWRRTTRSAIWFLPARPLPQETFSSYGRAAEREECRRSQALCRTLRRAAPTFRRFVRARPRRATRSESRRPRPARQVAYLRCELELVSKPRFASAAQPPPRAQSVAVTSAPPAAANERGQAEARQPSSTIAAGRRTRRPAAAASTQRAAGARASAQYGQETRRRRMPPRLRQILGGVSGRKQRRAWRWRRPRRSLSRSSLRGSCVEAHGSALPAGLASRSSCEQPRRAAW